VKSGREKTGISDGNSRYYIPYRTPNVRTENTEKWQNFTDVTIIALFQTTKFNVGRTNDIPLMQGGISYEVATG